MAKVELKQPIVEEISELLNGAATEVVVDYRGLTVAEETDQRICKECRDKIKIVKTPACQMCGKQLTSNNALYCQDLSLIHIYRILM